MTGYLQLAIAVLAVGIPAAFVLFVPFVAVLYRTGRRPTVLAVLASMAVFLYTLALWAYTVLPPPGDDPCLGPRVTPQLVPFATVRQVAGADGLRAMLTDPATTTAVLNVALFVPLGVGVAMLVRRRPLRTAAVTGLAVSLTVELVQLTGTLGLYDCAYRLFDVDDLLTNTAGALLGAAGAPLAALRRRRRGHDDLAVVSGRRRLLGALIDAFAVLTVALSTVLAVTLAAELTGPGSPAAELGTSAALTPLALGLPVLTLLVVVPVLTQGRTPGRWVVMVQSTDARGAPPRRSQTLRQVVTGGGGAGLAYTVAVSFDLIWLQAVVGGWVMASLVALGARDHRGLSGWASGTRLVDERTHERTRGVPDWTTRVDPDTAMRVLAVALTAAYGLLVASIWGLSKLGEGAPVALVPVVGTLVASQVAASGFLVANGVRMVRREARSLANLLSLAAGLGSALLIVTVVVVLLLAPPGVQLPVAVAFVVTSYASALFVGFVLLGRRWGAAPLRGSTGAIIVLGSRVIGDRVPPLLASRLRAAQDVREELLTAGEDPVIVPTGGRGAGEDISEGEAMARWLRDAGVPARAVLAETAARSTRENLALSVELLARTRPDVTLGRPVLVTNGYHVMRAATIAKDLDLAVAYRGAPTSDYFLPSALLREYIAILLRSPMLHAALAAGLAAVTLLALLL